ncbi:MAG: DUF4389 domain-containing protein [Myxococcales bacterium]|nr:DUF4389 domain-containing protein [Myxococcales bacterium]
MATSANPSSSPDGNAHGGSVIDRGATGIRILLTLVFSIVARLVEVVLTVIVLFDLGFTLITQKPPSRKIREFANQACTYLYRIARYLTYNEAEPPFPFTDFPDVFEPPTSDYDDVEYVPRDTARRPA